MNKIKLGDKVKLVKTIKQHTIVGDELFLKGTIGIVCDDDNPNCPIVEINNSNGKHTISGFNINDLKIIYTINDKKELLGLAKAKQATK